MYGFDKKKDNSSNDMKKDAKLSVLKELRKMASDMMGEDLKHGMDMKKVMVASPSKEGLREGLEKAENALEKMPGEESSDEKEMADSEEEYDPMTNWDDDLDQYSSDELEKKIQLLQAAKEKKMK